MSVSPKLVRRAGATAAGLAAVSLVLTACGEGSSAGTVTGEGSTAQQKAIEHFASVLTDNDGAILDYTGSGSGDGIKKFLASDVDFAGSDSPLKEAEVADAKNRCGGNDAWHLPLVAGPVAIAFNVPGVDKLNLDAPTLAKIFDSKITSWDDPAIKALNPDAKLPATKIIPVHRSDSSGTTDNFTRYLNTAAPAEWPYEHSKEWKGQGGSGASKSTGVGDTVKKTEGAVTYVEWGFATENQLSIAAIDFGAGATELTAATAGKALDAAEFVKPDSKDLVVDTGALYSLKEAGAYPLVLTTYEIVCSTGYADAEVSKNLKSAFTTILDKGQTGLDELGYVPLPEAFKTKLRGTIDAL
ncbi:phosphate ABC transporter substrate-binding protein PstS [Gordonia sp. (in: high G+C Gram-positive bacteria)]|uniref:phosphate ABC transporter substrate-binding protein PstS n=1 Tax=Gordonia sp. (in: high G+C Gram-positive bacteria) TaxID=84139 RepID=UPI0016B21CE1|nr:phosphate ABC transporter substrate-binding protein PstS [Gordonia sp. (in: high G+C Gram-positive bacteria)]NLG46152.1 phosphate ABC transporter substrate-binding protein PstS [Gordonia sp. (in: high G+C Gram-positive bacteria)]